MEIVIDINDTESIKLTGCCYHNFDCKHHIVVITKSGNEITIRICSGINSYTGITVRPQETLSKLSKIRLPTSQEFLINHKVKYSNIDIEDIIYLGVDKKDNRYYLKVK